MTIRTLPWWLGGLVLLAAAINVNDPYLVPVQDWSVPALIVLGLLGLLRLARRRCDRRLLALWLAVPVAVLGGEAVFQARKAAVLAAAPADLGQHVVVGFRQVAEVEGLAARGLIGGVFVTRRNLAGRDAEGLRRDIAHLQDIRRRNGLPPLLVATDQEGGTVSHLSPWLPNRPGLPALATLPADQRTAAARDLGVRHGQDLAAVGVTVNFAPVVDLRLDRGRNLLDFHTLIRDRAISADPALTGELAQAYAEGLASQGVRPTVKHFPGLGAVAEDTHHFRARLSTPRAQLQDQDWQPFRQVLAAQPDALLMVGHVEVDAVDPDRPASTSRRVVQELVRDGWGFGGLVVTDDLAMAPIYQHGFCAGVVGALNAGVDLLLLSYDGKQVYRALACAIRAQRRGTLDPAQRAASQHRLRNALTAPAQASIMAP